jgi:hypothetical protein
MQLLYSQPHSNIFHGHFFWRPFFFEETSSKRAGSSYNPLKKKRIDPVYRETGPKNLTTARFINGLLGGKPAKKKPRHNGPDSKLLEAYLTLGWSD